MRGAPRLPIAGGGRRVLRFSGASLYSMAWIKKFLSEIPSRAARLLARVRISSGSSIVVRICHNYGIFCLLEIAVLTAAATALDILTSSSESIMMIT